MHSGLRHLRIPDPSADTTFPALVQYPTEQPPRGVTLGPFTWDASLDAPLAPGRFPICVISHGAGGSHLLYREVATHLARQGWIGVCPESPRDNRNDHSLSYTDEAVSRRCLQLSQTLDTVLADDFFHPAADPDRISLVGHSLGGCAALALAGGQPWSRNATPIPVQPDPRFRAAVLMTPATAYFNAPAALEKISIPLLVLAGEKDDITPANDIQHTLRPLPSTVLRDFIVVRNAGHYSFLSPFPAPLRRPDFPPSQDPAGFDRERFHRELPGIIESFLAQVL
jgi:Predicted dienelactone hydrolase